MLVIAVPTVPVIVADVTTGFAGLIVIVNVPIPLPLIFFAVSPIIKVPVAVGVPDITPVLVFKLKPAGNVVVP